MECRVKGPSPFPTNPEPKIPAILELKIPPISTLNNSSPKKPCCFCLRRGSHPCVPHISLEWGLLCSMTDSVAFFGFWLLGYRSLQSSNSSTGGAFALGAVTLIYGKQGSRILTQVSTRPTWPQSPRGRALSPDRALGPIQDRALSDLLLLRLRSMTGGGGRTLLYFLRCHECIQRDKCSSLHILSRTRVSE